MVSFKHLTVHFMTFCNRIVASTSVSLNSTTVTSIYLHYLYRQNSMHLTNEDYLQIDILSKSKIAEVGKLHVCFTDLEKVLEPSSALF